MSNSQSILIIDDEAQIRKLLTITLQSNNYKVIEAATGNDGVKLVSSHTPDLVLLDLGLPDESGHDVLKHLREWFSNPILIISIQTNEEDIVKALDNGANDYLIKPFRTGELLARIRSALKKAGSEPNIPTAVFNELSIDFANRVVKKNNATVKLTATEYSLLSLFARNDGKVLTHQFLLKQVWGSSQVNESQYLRVFVAQLRKKIETDPNRPRYIITESGIGYRFIGNQTAP
jgi:two-component system, OmpR family, KDP operon response regulator KdpE